MKGRKTLDFSKNYIIENDRIKLSPLSLKNIDQLAVIANTPQIWTYFLEEGLGKENFIKYIHSAIDEHKQGKSYPFLVFDKSKSQVAGMTRLYDFIPELGTIKMGHTWYGTAFQGSGTNKHCKFLLFEFLFEKIKLERVGFGVHGENLRSIAALKSVGVKQEGVLRNFLNKTNGIGRVDLLHFSILKEEWLTKEKKALKQKLN